MNRVDLIRSVGDGTKINRDNEGLISLGTALSQKVMKTLDCISTKGTRVFRLNITPSLETFPPTSCHDARVIKTS